MKIWASVASKNAVAMPTRATTHIQKIAPGPPYKSAAATPNTLPMPTRAASEIAKAWKEEMPPSAPLREPRTVRTISGKRRSCTPRETTVRITPTPIRMTIVRCIVIQSAMSFSSKANSSTGTSRAVYRRGRGTVAGPRALRGPHPRVVWDPFILPQACAPSRRRLAKRMARCFRTRRPGLVDELREGPGGAGTQTWALSGTMGV